jgi:hypothetical protein
MPEISAEHAAFREWVESIPETPLLSDEAISRARMYPDRWMM